MSEDNEKYDEIPPNLKELVDTVRQIMTPAEGSSTSTRKEHSAKIKEMISIVENQLLELLQTESKHYPAAFESKLHSLATRIHSIQSLVNLKG